ncbi:LysE family translocator [Alphaproteobacteria bacterium LSUCC0684]
MDNIIAYLSAIFVLMIIPGADMAYVMANGIAYGRTGAAMAALGISLGGLVMTGFLWAVLHFAIALSPEALIYFQYIGACYLIYLSLTLLRASDVSESVHPTVPPLKALILRGVMTNISNPKVSIFFFAFIPPFIPPHIPDPALYAFFLGVLLCVVGGVMNFVFGLSGSLLQGVFARQIKGRPVANLILSALFGLIGFSIIILGLMK